MYLEVRTDDGSVNVIFGTPAWEDDCPKYSFSQDGRELYWELSSMAKAAMNKAVGSMASFNLHKFYAPGYENSMAQDPTFIRAYPETDTASGHGRDLIVDLYMNEQGKRNSSSGIVLGFACTRTY